MGKRSKVTVPSVTPVGLGSFRLNPPADIPQTRREKLKEMIARKSRTIFVGNLSVTVTEKENLRKLKSLFSQFGKIETIRFRSILCLSMELSFSKSIFELIANVRVIRDRATNVGKGFGYVQFAERSSVSLALKLQDTDLNGRKVRITHGNPTLADGGKPSTTKVVEGNRASVLKRLSQALAELLKR
ncbi:hypothetical protein BSLG_008919 [Batrachochytrium salamandrivorans]|nr:hypothetical protein BSLG_008919 [Batrachochytrium salamandrivorans]